MSQEGAATEADQRGLDRALKAISYLEVRAQGTAPAGTAMEGQIIRIESDATTGTPMYHDIDGLSEGLPRLMILSPTPVQMACYAAVAADRVEYLPFSGTSSSRGPEGIAEMAVTLESLADDLRRPDTTATVSLIAPKA